ncbi:hypothetical protein [Pseudoduganella albidiflava]|uniref:LexA regulated protein n=1 Tax=Pseudoduganella albidiflava TaxID=321983 RepID=A0A411WUW5_9BURK|nr:hypothetical protein [Pseudoduganella albidiflava]QBI00412.1 hypothetical protein EYF70_05775 [Pseudoduganella albidiflava]GGY53712.1 hypothetical protein GCM10007387_40210 [Pseudoduganella albidiflava]
MKKTDLAKFDAKKLMGKVAAPGAAFGNAVPPAVDKREQRKRDQALGLVPFAVKLNSELVKQLQALAAETGQDLNVTVAEVLARGLAADPGASKT